MNTTKYRFVAIRSFLNKLLMDTFARDNTFKKLKNTIILFVLPKKTRHYYTDLFHYTYITKLKNNKRNFYKKFTYVHFYILYESLFFSYTFALASIYMLSHTKYNHGYSIINVKALLND